MSDQSTSAQVVYKDIPNFPGYRAGSDGSIWSCWKSNGIGQKVMSLRWKRLKPSPRKRDGRGRCSLKASDGTYIRLYVSHFVLFAFVGPCPEGLEACHDDGICTNDAPSNLRWDTHSANLLDRRRHGTNVQGEKINTAKLTTNEVLEIRRIGKPLKQHAIRYGVSEALVSAILKRKVWQHV